MDTHTKLVRWALFLSHFTNEKIKTEKIEVTCLRRHSCKAAVPGFIPKRYTPKAQGPNHQLFCLWGLMQYECLLNEEIIITHRFVGVNTFWWFP